MKSKVLLPVGVLILACIGAMRCTQQQPGAAASVYATPSVVLSPATPSPDEIAERKRQAEDDAFFVAKEKREARELAGIQAAPKETREYVGNSDYQHASESPSAGRSLGRRTGARCADGTISSATGEGACSHHGGVAAWLSNGSSGSSERSDWEKADDDLYKVEQAADQSRSRSGADELSLRRQSIGGGDLSRIGATGTELNPR